jgi:hypothetical protein
MSTKEKHHQKNALNANNLLKFLKKLNNRS